MKSYKNKNSFIKTTFREFLNEGEINWEREKSWKIKDQFPIEVFVKKSWTGRHYVVEVPTMSMSYEVFQDLKKAQVEKTEITIVGGAMGECLEDIITTAESLGLRISKNPKFIYSAKECPIK